MLIGFVVLCLAITIAIGLWAARRVQDAKDYVVAGRRLPLYMNTATVFATWFGAESVLSVSVEFSRGGLRAVIADPFGSSACLVIVALLFARAFYRMDLLTIGDFYRRRYGRAMSTASGALLAPTSLCTENIVRPLWPGMSDRQLLVALRVVLVAFTAAAVLLALRSTQTMYGWSRTPTR